MTLTLVTDGFQINDITTWTVQFGVVFAGAIWLGLEILSRFLPLVCGTPKAIKVKGKHLDKFESIDLTFIFINKLFTIMFVYHVIQVTWSTPSVKWAASELSVANTIGSFVAFVAFYDYFYMWFHYFLHVRWLYPWIHKHHHRQKAPSRGNLDAINVHPFEYITGEYLHLLTIYLIPCHISAVVVFILLGGILASLNHTRFDIELPLGLYDVKAHDVHHRIPESNYGQYTMYWDKLHGFYRSYEGKEKKAT